MTKDNGTTEPPNPPHEELSSHRSNFSPGCFINGLILTFCILPILLTAGFPVYQATLFRMQMTKHIDQMKRILDALQVYAIEHEGNYPGYRNTESPLKTSTEAFNDLIRDAELETEVIFYVKGNPEKNRPPNQDGKLTQEENCFVYVGGLTTKSDSNLPLIADEMISPGIYGDNHPWLKNRKAFIGYNGGHVIPTRLSKRSSGPVFAHSLKPKNATQVTDPCPGSFIANKSDVLLP